MKRRTRSLSGTTPQHEKDLELYLKLGNRFLEDARTGTHRCVNAMEALYFAGKAGAENSHIPMSAVRPSEITQLDKRAREAILKQCGCWGPKR